MKVIFYTKIPHCPACRAMLMLLQKYKVEYVEEWDMTKLTSIRYVENQDGLKYVEGRQPAEGDWTLHVGFSAVPWLELEDGRLLNYKDARVFLSNIN